MDTEKTKIVIDSEEKAWEVLQYVNEASDDLEELELVFEGWPTLQITVKSPQHQASLTAQNMAGLIELQKTIYRSYSQMLHASNSMRHLSKVERKQLEIVFAIEHGSSDIKAILEDQLAIIVTKVAEKMEPKHVIGTVVAAGLLWAGTSCWSSWLQYQKDVQQSQVKKEESMALIEERKFESQQDTERMKIMASIAMNNQTVARVQQESEQMYHEVIKKTAGADTVSVAGVVDIPGPAAQALVKNPVAQSQEVRLDGKYRILKVDSSGLDKFKVYVINIESGEEFSAVVQNVFVHQDRKNQERLQAAEWERTPVELVINAKRLRGDIRNAIIIKVGED